MSRAESWMKIREQLRDACKVVGGEWDERFSRCIVLKGVEVRFVWPDFSFLEVVQEDEEEQRKLRILLSTDDIRKIEGIKGGIFDEEHIPSNIGIYTKHGSEIHVEETGNITVWE